MNSSLTKTVFFILLFFLSGVGFFILFFSTRYGIGIGPDSCTYIMASRNLLNGFGVYLSSFQINPDLYPMTHFPPLFPMILCIPGVFGIDPMEGARIINLIFYSANILLIGLVVFKLTNDSFWPSILASFSILISYCLISIHSYAISEPLYIFLSVSGIYFLIKHIYNFNLNYYLLSALFISLAFLTRYAGITLIFSCCIFLYSFIKKPFLKKMLYTLSYGILCFIPMAIWLSRNIYLTGRATDRTIKFHMYTSKHLSSFVSGFANLIVPMESSLVSKALLAILVLSILVISSILIIININYYYQALDRLHLFIIYSIVYIIFLLLSILLFDSSTFFDYRILSPIYVNLIIIFSGILYYFNKSDVSDRLIYLLSSLIIIGLSFSSYSTMSRLITSYYEGIGFNKEIYKSSSILNSLRIKYKSDIIFTNSPDLIYIVTGNITSYLPRKYSASSLENNFSYEKERTVMDHLLENKRAIVLWINEVNYRNNLLSLRNFLENSRYTIYEKNDIGLIIGVSG